MTVGAVKNRTSVPTCCSAYLVDLEYFCHIFIDIKAFTHGGFMFDRYVRFAKNILPTALEFAVWKTGWLWLAFNVDANTENLKLLHLRVSTEN